MNELIEQLINYYDIDEADEVEKFKSYAVILEPLIVSNISKILSNTSATYRKLNAESAFKELLNIACINSKSNELKLFYKEYAKREDIDIIFNEIITDTIYDESKFRVSSNRVNDDDIELFKAFAEYDKLYETLYDLLNGMINSMLSLYEMNSEKFEEMRMNLIKEIVPTLVKHSRKIKNIWPISDNQNNWLVYFLYSIQRDLEQINSNNETRFKRFFEEDEYERIVKMKPDQLQVYLATAAANNINMREAKNLVKNRQEVEYYKKCLIDLEKELNITLEMVESAKQHASKFQLIEVETNDE